MFDRLIDLIIKYINAVLPVAVVFQYQSGIRMRFGKAKGGVLMPGLHWKIPIFDHIAVEHCVETTITLPAQSLTTKDKKRVVVRGVIGYRIDDVCKFFYNVWNQKDALSDKGCIIVKCMVAYNNLEDLDSNEFDEAFKEVLQERVDCYGIEVLYASLIDITECRSFRLFNEQNIIG